MTTAIITLILLILTLVILSKKYNVKVLLHPTFYFLIMWILSIISFILFELAGFKLIEDRKLFNELMFFIIFTSICIIFWNNRKDIKSLPVSIDLFISKWVFKFFSIIFCLVALISLIQSGFDLAYNREVTNINVFSTVSGEKDIIGLILGTIKMLNVPFILYGGWVVGSYYARKEKTNNLLYYLPIITVILDTLSHGGRASIVSGFLMFILGFLMGYFTFYNFSIDPPKLGRLLKYGLVLFLIYSAFSTYISYQRSERSNIQNQYLKTIENKYSTLRPFSGLLEYLVFHYQGYQLRRKEIEYDDPQWGQNTFAFITHFNVPIISQVFGENLSIQNLFNLQYIDPVERTLRNQSEGRRGASITATVYFILYKDFGFYGTLAAIFIFTGLTQKLFRRLFLRNHYNFWSIILFLALFQLWTQSFFSHHLSGAWFNGYLYPIFIIETVNYFSRRSFYSASGYSY